MIEIEKPQIECIETPGDATYGKYVVEPLERGYGTTLGNALRRIMLSSLPGTAPTTIKIAGVQHEFSTIPGVKEDVTEIVLNVKGLLTKLHCETVKTVYIEAVGPCEVKAGDIKADGEVEVLNPDMHIATLDNGATLNMEITLSFTEKAVEKLADAGFDKVYGARPLRRAIQNAIEDSLSEEILSGKIKRGDTVLCDATDEGYSFTPAASAKPTGDAEKSGEK